MRTRAMDSFRDYYVSLRLHDLVGYRGRSYRVIGFSPVSVAPERVWLLDAVTGERVNALARELHPVPEPLPAA